MFDSETVTPSTAAMTPTASVPADSTTSAPTTTAGRGIKITKFKTSIQ